MTALLLHTNLVITFENVCGMASFLPVDRRWERSVFYALEDFEDYDEHGPGHYLLDQTIYKISRSGAFIYHQEEEEDASPTYLALPHHGRSDYSNHMRIPIRTSGVIIIRLCVLEIKGMWWRTVPCGYLSERKVRTSCARQIYRRCVSCSATRSSRGDSGPVSSSRKGRSCERNTSLPSHIEMEKVKWNPCHSHGSAARFWAHQTTTPELLLPARLWGTTRLFRIAPVDHLAALRAGCKIRSVRVQWILQKVNWNERIQYKRTTSSLNSKFSDSALV